MALLTGFRLTQLAGGLPAAVCGRLFADLGAEVACADPDLSTPLAVHLNAGKFSPGQERPHLIVGDTSVAQQPAGAPRVAITPFGLTGPAAAAPATDLTVFYASGIARLLTGQVDDLAEAPIRPVGEQSAFISGLAAACAGMIAALGPQKSALIDVSMQEAVATLAITELARAGMTGRKGSRKRLTDGNGATVCILPASDGYVAISPREDKQWDAWLEAMGSPDWGREARFARKSDRVANWDALHALMSEWSRQHTKQWIADTAQTAHVPSFPLKEMAEHFGSEQLRHRGFWRAGPMPNAPFGLTLHPGTGQKTRAGNDPLPLSGVRVLDFSWVIAGPTATRYLAAMGAEVIKVEAPGRGDPGRASELHSVLGQAKKAIVLDLKKPEDRAAARALARTCDVLVENFATGVMDRLGLGADALRAENPDLIYVSASGMGRTGPEANAVAYGTLMQCYAGFAGLNRHPDRPPRVGFAWLDPMLGLMLAFATAAALWRRRETGEVARIDCSMIEALLWTLAGPLLQGAEARPMGNRSDTMTPHGAWRCAGEDDWIAIVVRNDADWDGLCGCVPALAGLHRQDQEADIDTALTAWCQTREASATAETLRRAGVPAAALANSASLVIDPHLRARGFWDAHQTGVLPGLPWRSDLGRAMGPAPEAGADNDSILATIRSQSVETSA